MFCVENSLLQRVEDKPAIKEDTGSSEKETPSLNLVPAVEEVSKVPQAQEEIPMISFDAPESTVDTDIIRQPSPPPVLAEVQDLTPAPGQLTAPKNEIENPFCEDYVCSETPMQLHIVRLLFYFFHMS